MNQSDEHLQTTSNGDQDGAETGWERTAWRSLALAFAAGLLVSATLTGWLTLLFPEGLRAVGVIIQMALLLTASGLLFQSARLAFRTPYPVVICALILLAVVLGGVVLPIIFRVA